MVAIVSPFDLVDVFEFMELQLAAGEFHLVVVRCDLFIQVVEVIM